MVTYPAPNPPFIPARHKGGRQVPRAIVMHGTVSSDNAGTARRIAQWWAGSTSPVTSAHYTVDPKEVIQSVGDHTVAYHCGSNQDTIGVEMCDEQAGPVSRWLDADSQAIIKRSARLVAELCLAYNIQPVRPTVAALKSKGKHGIYGHNDSRLAFGNTSHTDPRDFPWAQFIKLVQTEVSKIKAAAAVTKPKHRARVGHASLQFSDTPAQWRHDVEEIFSRKYEWITGTEAGEADNYNILIAAAKKYGYTVRRYKSNWIAVSRSAFKTGTFTWGVKTVVDSSLVVGPGHDTNYLWVTFTHAVKGVGKISVVCSHYPTKGKPEAKDPAYRVNLRWTKKIALAVVDKLRGLSAGTALGFYGGDQNISDKLSDTFFGGPVTSCWDELKKWPNTGHGPIDVIASVDADARVKCVAAKAWNDTDMKLYTDHFFISAAYDIELL